MNKVEGMDFRYLMQNQKKIKTNSSSQKEGKRVVEYDFKIVSFKIGNEYYGIDIMSVKEILKEKKFTRIPNALEFVRGVLNLRGDIIPVIDLAKMFNLDKNKETSDELCSIVIIKVENLLIGIIVEQIQHVIPLRKDDIQPPSPLLGSINERFINGVVDINDRLYVILDTDMIFSDKEKAKKETIPQDTDLSEEFFVYFINQIEELCGVHVNTVNKSRIRDFYNEYVKENNIKEMPKVSKEIADTMLKKFLSTNTDEFWEHGLVDRFTDSAISELSKICSDEVRLLNVGCGNGFETFSIFLAVYERMNGPDVRAVAMDINLASVSSASGLEVDGNMIPSWMNKSEYFTNTGGNLYKINKAINDKIYFEFHDAKNIAANHKKFDIIVARDMSLYLKEAEYMAFLEDLSDKLSKGGVLVLGDNEIISNPKFSKVNSDRVSVYVKNK